MAGPCETFRRESRRVGRASTKPTNWSDPPPASDDVLQFPSSTSGNRIAGPKRRTAASCPIDLLLMLFRGGKAVHTIVGNQVDDIVVVGPAPLDDEGQIHLKRDPATGRLVLATSSVGSPTFRSPSRKGLDFASR